MTHFKFFSEKNLINSLVLQFISLEAIHTKNNLIEILSNVQTIDVSFIFSLQKNIWPVKR